MYKAFAFGVGERYVGDNKKEYMETNMRNWDGTAYGAVFCCAFFS
jgi:hypothetical protein